MADLVVELYRTRVGVLTGPWRTFDFVTEPPSICAPAAVVSSRSTSPRGVLRGTGWVT